MKLSAGEVIGKIICVFAVLMAHCGFTQGYVLNITGSNQVSAGVYYQYNVNWTYNGAPSSGPPSPSAAWTIYGGTIASSGTTYAYATFTSSGVLMLSVTAGGNTYTKSFYTTLNTCTSPPSGSFSVATSTCAPRALTFTGTPPAGVTYYWQTSSSGTSTSYPASSPWNFLTPGTIYMRAYKTSGSCWSTDVSYSVSTVTAAPATPTNPTADNNVCGSKALFHAIPPSGQTWYWQGQNPTGTSYLNSGTDLAFTSGTYFLRARDNLTNCWSINSGYVAVTINTNESVPATPLSSSNFCGNKTLSKNGSPPSGESWYWQGLNPSGTDYTSSDATASTYTATVSGTYILRSRNSLGCWGPPAMINVTVRNPPPLATVEGLGGFDYGTSSFKLQWAPVASATSYDIDISETNTFSTILQSITGVTTTTAAVSSIDMTGNKVYYARIRAYGECTQSDLSPAAKIYANNYNYVRTVVLRKQGLATEQQVTDATLDEKNISYSYLDPLGRPSQNVAVQASPSNQDIVQPFVYNSLGLQTVKYLPFAQGTTGWFKHVVEKDQPGYTSSPYYLFYNNPASPIANDIVPTGEMTFEISPLHRTLKEYGPGVAWSSQGNNKPSEIRYLSNIHGTGSNLTDEKVIAWEIDVSNMPVRAAEKAGVVLQYGYYASAQLSVRELRDENGNNVREYRDKQEYLVLKKIQVVAGSTDLNSATDWTLTYYIYDDFGNLRIVLQPELSQTAQNSNTYVPTPTDLAAFAFQYTYDSRKRMTSRQIPGSDAYYMVYDDADRVILTQDGNQRAGTNKYWTFTKYDWLNRIVMTGIKDTTATLTQAQMQAAVNTHYAKAWAQLNETYIGSGLNNVHGYTNKAYPTVTGPGLTIDPERYLSVSYYDTYDFKSLWSSVAYDYSNEYLSGQAGGQLYTQPATAWSRVRGQMTGNKVKVLDGGVTGGTTWLKGVNYYDDRSRLIQSVTDNYKGFVDRKTILLDFIGQEVKSVTRHLEQCVAWSSLVGSTYTGNTLTRTAAGNSWGTSGGFSVQNLAAGKDGWIELVIDNITTRRSIGLSADNPDADEASIDYSFHQYLATLYIRENGNTITTFSNVLQVGDVLKIERKGSVVTYFRNGTALQPSSVASASALYVDASLYTAGTSWSAVKISFDQQPSYTITRRAEYDRMNRLTRVWHRLNTGTEILLLANQYNELGQLLRKGLHSEVGNPSAMRQNMDYRYNIRGWAKSINDSDLSSEPGDLFGINFDYENTTSLSSTPMYNGNISAVRWSNNAGAGPVKENAYAFTYDASNRLLTSAFQERKNSTWTPASNFGFAENLEYDRNGNVKRLWRNDNRSSGWMDNLTLTYGAGASLGNRLWQVSDAGDVLVGFRDGLNSGDDYSYDGNGNLQTDLNKGISGAITYNAINMPELITRGSNTIRNIYSSDGKKLAQIVSGTVPLKKTEYSNNFEYVNNVLQTIGHEEGRVVMVKEEKVFIFEGEGTAKITATAGVTLSNETIDDRKYLKVSAASGSSLSGRGIIPVGGTFNVHPGEQYTLRVKGYSGAEPVVLQIKTNGTNLLWPGMQLPTTAGQEGWIEARITVPGGHTTLQAGVTWNSSATTAQSFYINDLELVEVMKGDPDYQYHLRDNLGNARVTFTANPETVVTKATLEPEFANSETSNFIYYDEAVKINAVLFNKTTGTTTKTSTRLSGGNTNEIYGLARSVSVMPGDKFNIEVYAKYVDPTSTNWGPELAALMSQISQHSSSVFLDEGLPGSLGGGAFPYTGTLVRDNDTGAGPKAYLNYILFDRNFKLVNSGFRRLSTDAKESGLTGIPTGVPHERLAFDNLVITEPGYIYIYLSNENETPVEVYFDDFKVEHIQSPIVQQNDYYPFGMQRTSSYRENVITNQYRYNSKELVDELSLEWYDYIARQYDPQLGRFLSVDPLSENARRWSPYAYAFNNPIRFIDKDGMSAEETLLRKDVLTTTDLRLSVTGEQEVNHTVTIIKDTQFKDQNGNKFTKRVTIKAEVSNTISSQQAPNGRLEWTIEEGNVKVTTEVSVWNEDQTLVDHKITSKTLTQENFTSAYREEAGMDPLLDLRDVSNFTKVISNKHQWAWYDRIQASTDWAHTFGKALGGQVNRLLPEEAVMQTYEQAGEVVYGWTSGPRKYVVNMVSYHSSLIPSVRPQTTLLYYNNQRTGQRIDYYNPWYNYDPWKR